LRHPRLPQSVTRLFCVTPKEPLIQHCMPFICASRVLGEQGHAGTKPAMYQTSAAMVATVNVA
jgi:hypothetical protein